MDPEAIKYHFITQAPQELRNGHMSEALYVPLHAPPLRDFNLLAIRYLEWVTGEGLRGGRSR
jgi:hypothetical protein